jgi:hypothetical protein
VVLKTELRDAVNATIKTEYPKIEEMLDWYRNQKTNENIIDVPEIDFNN